MESRGKKKASKGRGKKRSGGRKARTRAGHAGIAGAASMGETVNASPTQASVLAQVAPFNITRGVASVLKLPRPSQKITARAIGTILVTNGQNMLLALSPCVANNTTWCSAIAWCGNSTQLGAATSTLVSTYVGTGWPSVTPTYFTTNTPYPAATLGDGSYNWRLVSSGIRIRNTTSVFNRGGVVKTFIDSTANVLPNEAATSYTFQSIINTLNANHKVVRYNSASVPDVEVCVPHCESTDGAWFSATSQDDPKLWYAATAGSGGSIAGGTTSTYKGAFGPAYVFFENATGSSQSFDVEIVEHWEINGSSIEVLHTPSPSHANAYDLLHNVANSAIHQHSQSPHLSFHSIVKGAVKMEHNKAALQDASCVATALAML